MAVEWRISIRPIRNTCEDAHHRVLLKSLKDEGHQYSTTQVSLLLFTWIGLDLRECFSSAVRQRRRFRDGVRSSNVLRLEMCLSEDRRSLKNVEENKARILSKTNWTTSLSLCFTLFEQSGQGPEFSMTILWVKIIHLSTTYFDSLGVTGEV